MHDSAIRLDEDFLKSKIQVDLKNLPQLPQFEVMQKIQKKLALDYDNDDVDNSPATNSVGHTIQNSFSRVSSAFDTENHSLRDSLPNLVQRWVPHDITRWVLIYQPKKLLIARGIPTASEVKECTECGGISKWLRNGEWVCLKKEVDLYDAQGPVFFSSFEEFRRWKVQTGSGKVHKVKRSDIVEV